MNLFVSPVDGYKLADWTMSSLVWKSKTRWGNRDQHVVRFLNAIDNKGFESVPFHFSLDLKV